MRLLSDELFHIIQLGFVTSVGSFQAFVNIDKEIFPGDDTAGNTVCGMGIIGGNNGNHMGLDLETLITQK